VSIVERLNTDLKAAMKDRDTERLATLRMAISAMNYRRIEKSGQLSDDEQLDVMRKQVKQREDSIAEFTRGKRADLAAKETREREILKTYLPAELEPAALAQAVRELVATLGPQPQFGAAMKAAMATLKDKASGKAIGDAVRAALEQKTS
jgi:uncharacterized protein